MTHCLLPNLAELYLNSISTSTQLHPILLCSAISTMSSTTPTGTFPSSLGFTPSPELIRSAHAAFAANPIPASNNTPKRVILRIGPNPRDEYEDDKYQEYIITFLLRCGPTRCVPNTSYSIRHYYHIQPPYSSIHTWHIILDMEKGKFSRSDFDQLPHEIYKVVRREDGSL
jgi:hypothetical protein